jgi:DNA invertase Pin-like site-specific DNA recombinase
LNDNSIERLSREGGPEKYVFTNVQVESAKLSAQGYSLSQIARKLGKNPQDISRGLKSFEKVYRCMYQTVKELSAVAYLKKKIDYKKLVERSVKNREQKAKEGYWPGTVPRGYKIANGIMVIDSEKALIVKQVFEGCSKGEEIKMIRERTGLKDNQIRNILHNPLYMGEIRWRGQVYRGKHEPIISKELWDSVQHSNKSMCRVGRAPFGFRWVVGRLFKEPEKVKKVSLIFKMATEHQGVAAISRATGIPRFNVSNIIKNRFYKEHRIVSAEIWQKAQQNRPKKGEVTKEIARKYGVQMRLKIINILPATTLEVARTLGIDKATAHKWTRRLSKENVIEQTNRLGKWYVRKEYQLPQQA